MPPTSSPWYRRPFPLIAICLTAVFLLGMGLFAGQVWHYYGQFKSGKKAPLKEEQLRTSISRVFDATGNADQSRVLPKNLAPKLGTADAPIKIVEFIDFDCPYCRETEPVVKEFLRRHGKEVSFIIREFPLTELHPQAEDSAMAARCVFTQGNADRYWKFQDRLFGTQGAHDVTSLRTYAGQVGADLAVYDNCIARHLPSVDLQTSLDDGIAAGVQGTPTFFFNGVKFQGAMTLEAMELAFEEAKKRFAAKK